MMNPDSNAAEMGQMRGAYQGQMGHMGYPGGSTPQMTGQKAPMLGQFPGAQYPMNPVGGGEPKRYNGTTKLIFFCTAVVTLAAGIIAVLDLFFAEFLPFDLINALFMCGFGVIMLIVDSPCENNCIRNFQLQIFRYMLCLTRFTGRGVIYFFLGTLVFGLLWDNSISYFLAVALGGAIMAVGGFALFFGITKTMKVDGLKKMIIQRGQKDTACPPQGMTSPQFIQMARQFNTNFTERDVDYILIALSFTLKPDMLISQAEFRAWMDGGMVMI